MKFKLLKLPSSEYMANNSLRTRKLLHSQLKDIHLSLTETYKDESQIGVFSGISGNCLFHFYFSKYSQNEEYYNVGVKMIEETIHRINNGYTFPTYCSGIAGAGWVLEHLRKEGFIELDTDPILQHFDEFLFRTMIIDMKSGNYDFLHGALGYGFYFLKRFKNTASKNLKTKYSGFLHDLIRFLKKTAVTDEQGIRWLSIVNRVKNEAGYNLSLSHGIASILNFLARLYEHPEFKSQVEPLLKGAIQYTLSYKNKDGNTFYMFPSWISEPYRACPSRLSWCYGDLGLGVSLRMAALAINDTALLKTSIVVLEHAAKRRTFESSLVKDSAICHGAYGNALIFERLYRETGNTSFKAAADYWILEGLSMANFSDGYAGYKQWDGANMGWKNESGFLTGIAGIGMVTLFYLSEFESSWDECLMVS